MAKPSEFDRIRSAVREMEEVMSATNNVLNNPLRIFDASKCVESEKIVKDNIQTCQDMISEVAHSKDYMNHNYRATDDFLKQTKAFTSNISAGLDVCAEFLSRFGFKMPQDSIVDDDFTECKTECEIEPQMQNGTPAVAFETSGIQEFDDSPANSRFSNGTAKLNRELNFDH